MSARAFVLGLLTQRVGFQFDEEELSPSLRRKVGELADLRQKVEARNNTILQRDREIATLRSQRGNKTVWLAILIIAGVILLFVFLVGVVFLVGAYFVQKQRGKIDAQIRQASFDIVNLNTEIATISSALSSRLTAVSQEVLEELSTARVVGFQAAKTVQTVQTAETAQTSHTSSVGPAVQLGSNVQFVRETVREVVMIPCAYCRALMPQTSLKCPRCGATRET